MGLRQQGDALAKEVIEAVGDILLPHQADRLAEICLQVRGVQSLTEPEVARKLGLSKQQQEKLRTVQDELRRDMFLAVQGGQRGADAMRGATTLRIMRLKRSCSQY